MLANTNLMIGPKHTYIGSLALDDNMQSDSTEMI